MTTVKLRRKENRKLRKTHQKSWCQVYVLKDDKTNEIRYVGQTRNTLESRLINHIRSAKNNPKSPVEYWVRELLSNDRAPIIEMLDPNGIWFVSETVWIDRLLAEGHKLLNVQQVMPDRVTRGHYEHWGDSWGDEVYAPFKCRMTRNH